MLQFLTEFAHALFFLTICQSGAHDEQVLGWRGCLCAFVSVAVKLSGGTVICPVAPISAKVQTGPQTSFLSTEKAGSKVALRTDDGLERRLFLVLQGKLIENGLRSLFLFHHFFFNGRFVRYRSLAAINAVKSGCGASGRARNSG